MRSQSDRSLLTLNSFQGIAPDNPSHSLIFPLRKLDSTQGKLRILQPADAKFNLWQDFELFNLVVKNYSS
ncbi:hypothetical protein NIES4072_23020 [Nostoc commune NIES-4072]|uniref:Uncharacterized protein n=1 Tax=Nostoc commune NIES-4072 TaxID=2005467 RepID=A0A2R5FIS7_NOSCO|nr:hypothetical protein [Nostoc commune]BBD64036.1 hypothetical protein NIES4070_03780 [Nostoc commune HK-02]GBG18637.1 hypothetical protein NIES4072_23020 [Nostoc commune NIES-4072]